MSKKIHRPPQARPRLVDRIQLARSIGRHLDGIWIGCWRDRPEHLTRVEAALLLIKQHSPLDYARITRELERVWVRLLPHSLGEYMHSLRACILDERYVADPATTVEQIASTIVHEATHARLERCGIEYEEQRRTRIEAICFRRELAFAARLPDSAELQEGIARCLEWYPANPEQFSDAHFEKAHAEGAVEALRYLEAPDWIIRAFSISLPIFRRARSFFRFERRRIGRPLQAQKNEARRTTRYHRPGRWRLAPDKLKKPVGINASIADSAQTIRHLCEERA